MKPRLAVAAVILFSGALGLLGRYAFEPRTQTVAFGDPAPPSALPALLADILPVEECHAPLDAKEAVRQALIPAGLTSWSVRIAPQVKDDDCVSSTYDVAHQEVVLKLAMRPEIRRAIQEVAETLLKDCRDCDHAESLLRDTLLGVGEQGFDLRTDGSEAGPIEREAEVHAHFEAGCWIYSGSGWHDDGTPIYWIGGKH